MISYTSWAFGAYSLARKLCTKLIVKQRIISGDAPLNMALGNTRELGATAGTSSPFPPVALVKRRCLRIFDSILIKLPLTHILHV